jgi:sulfur dioxygenase
MPIAIEELNNTNCKCYLLTKGSFAILVDPVRERLETYRQLLEHRSLKLVKILETHTHADHLMLNRDARQVLQAPIVMHRNSPSPLVDEHMDEGDEILLDGEIIRVFHTPGHTLDSVCLVVEGAVLTGDTLLIGGSGRTDFPGGDSGTQYDAVTERLFKLPDETVVWPGHDYKGNTSSTIGYEKQNNLRFLNKTRAQYVELMAGLGLPFPEKIQQSLQINQSGFEADEVSFPLVTDLQKISEISAQDLHALLENPERPRLIDVREPEEFVGELGHISHALLIPMDMFQKRLPKLLGYADLPIVVICRAGARSAAVCALMNQAGFRSVRNLQGGMLAWVDQQLPVQH